MTGERWTILGWDGHNTVDGPLVRGEAVEVMSVEEHERAYWSGAYQALQRLSRSPRFNRPQLALIMDEAARVRERAEACGVKFTGPEPERPDLEKYR